MHVNVVAIQRYDGDDYKTERRGRRGYQVRVGWKQVGRMYIGSVDDDEQVANAVWDGQVVMLLEGDDGEWSWWLLS